MQSKSSLAQARETAGLTVEQISALTNIRVAVIKDLENIKGDILTDYKTIPIIYGEKVSKKGITALTIATLFPIYILIEQFDVGYMDIYFYSCLIILIFFLLKLWKSNTREDYLFLHNILKFLIVAGVFCIILINPSLVLNALKQLL